ncbi:MAG: hypothetical protein KGI25_05860, partial [Thaumarchaeota archaeon]|nr:hypothetical protein [Nitrososphaerota archaeon]
SNLESKGASMFHCSLVFSQDTKSMDANRKRVEKILVGLSIEKTLLQMGRPVFDKVEKLFSEKYHCAIMDAYDHPQYLSEILKEVFGNSHLEVVKSIEEFLTDFRNDHPIEEFIGKITV